MFLFISLHSLQLYSTEPYELLDLSGDKREERLLRKMPRVAVVTGGNKGIGFYIVKLLLQSGTQDVVYLTARDETRGLSAVEELKKLGLQPTVIC